MEKSQAIKLIEDVFDHSFDESRFVIFSSNLLNDFDKSKVTPIQSGNYVYEPYRNHIKSFKRIGQYTDPKGELLDILSVKVQNGYKLERTRTGLRNFAIEYLKRKENRDSLLIAFYSDDTNDWRFSYIKLEYKTFKDVKGKIKARQEATSARRYSFLVGENEPCFTAKKQLLPLLIESNENPTIEEIENCFNIEKVTKEFFEQYKLLFLNLKEKLDSLIKKDKNIAEDFQSKGIESTAFAKKLLGQIVFLYFIQKKGWLGVPKNESFGKGDKRFLKSLFLLAEKEKLNYFNDYLEPLFYEALAIQRSTVDPSYYKRFDCRIPFLNGGLFEPIKDYDWQKTEINLPNNVFSNFNVSKEGDVGNGILDVFDRFNFTVKEDEPLEKEVAVDPEMLGKVFENLLEIKDRKSKGAYYTPREIVHYMCQESLINYLDTSLNSYIGSYQEMGKDQTDLFGNKVRKGQTILEIEHNDIKVPKQDIDSFIKNSHLVIEDNRKEKNKRTWQLPDSIKNNAELFDKALSDIKVCDPAIGSGAFPVGMLNEIVRARTALTPYMDFKEEDSERTPYHLKRECIQNSLYGVDIDDSAIDIAKLRLWLSLVVDEESIQDIEPLPNLDYKIVCGNSLLRIEIDIFNVSYFEELEEKKKSYFSVTDPKAKRKLHKEIDEIIHKITNGKKDFDFEIYFSEVWHRQSKLVTAINAQIEALNKQIDSINIALQSIDQHEIIKLKFVAADQQIGIIEFEIKNLKEKIDELFGELGKVNKNVAHEPKDFRYEINSLNNSIDILNKKISEINLKLNLNNQRGGFDVVIGNPPYARKLPDDIKKMIKKFFKTASYQVDLYVAFFEKSVVISNYHGTITLITPNSWLKNLKMQSLRKFLLVNTSIKIIIPMIADAFENASVDNSITLLSRLKTENDKCDIKIIQNGTFITTQTVNPYDYTENEGAVFTVNANAEITKLLKKIQSSNQTIESICTVSRGINPYDALTGQSQYTIKNRAYHADYKKDKSFVPELKGKHVKPFGYHWDNKHFISYGPWLAAPREEKYFSGKRIILREIIGDRFYGTVIEEGFKIDRSLYIALVNKENNIDIYYLLGILLSKLYAYYFRYNNNEFDKLFPKIRVAEFKKLPIKCVAINQQRTISKLAQEIVAKKKSNCNTINLEAQLEARVAHLYNLTEPEYQLILEGTEDTFRITALNYFRDIQKGILK